MAVPKKRTSRSKKKARKSKWLQKGRKKAQKALSLAKSVLRGDTSFLYLDYDKSPEYVEEEMEEEQ